MSEPTWQNNDVAIGQILRLVPDELDRLFQNVADGVKSVVIAIRSGKNDNSEFHRVVTPWSIRGILILAHQPVFSGTIGGVRRLVEKVTFFLGFQPQVAKLQAFALANALCASVFSAFSCAKASSYAS